LFDVDRSFIKIPAKYSAIYGKDECDAKVRGIEDPCSSAEAGFPLRSNKLWGIFD